MRGKLTHAGVKTLLVLGAIAALGAPKKWCSV